MSTYKSRKQTANQRLIASFFAPANAKPASTTQAFSLPAKTPDRSLAGLRQNNNMRSQFPLLRSAFDDFASSDTSFTSPEVLNFRNPVLNRYSSNVESKPASQTEPLFVSDSDDDKENAVPGTRAAMSPLAKPALKRAASSNLFDILDGQPKRVLKKPSTSLHLPTPLSLTSDLVHLSSEQRAIVEAIVDRGENVFFTGSAGTGKSVVLRHLVDALNRKHGSFNVGITASTGLAACNISGQTLHKYLSIGLGTGSPQDLAVKIKRNGSAKKRWLSLAVLVIDEILMIDGKLFTKLDEIAKILRRNQQPFGGIQIVCSGDFYQLPPVAKDNTSQFCFQSPAWSKAMKRTIILTKVFRQKGDNQLIEMLNALREGSLSPEMIGTFHALQRKVHYTDGIEPTELFPTRQEVKRANDLRLHHLPGNMVTYIAKDSDNSPQLKRLFDNLMCEERVDLKVGAQVMYLKNHPESTVVNGSIGTVVGFMTEDLFLRVFSQFHPSDFINASLDFVSFMRLLSGLIGRADFTPEQRAVFEALPEKLQAKTSKLSLEAYQTPKQSELLPLINFQTNRDFTMILVRREEFMVDQGRVIRTNSAMPDSLVRTQLPLLLSWAMSIHKAQGQSIDRLRVDLRRVFEKGQVYVALSRATNKEHLEVLNFDHRRIAVSKDVRDFYSTLTSAS